MKKTAHLLKHYPLTLLCLALIFFLSLLIDVPESKLNDVTYIDKWTHFIMYGGTCSVMWWEYLRCHDRVEWWKLWLYAIIGMVVLGGVIELLQAYCTAHRSGEWLDFVADSLGVALGAGVGLLLNKKMRKSAK
ncbi:MAG: VanZ family protein [Prevotella sp.]|nr:VanZ family protein [Prevotella sp.]